MERHPSISHFHQRAIVFDDLRVLYVPVPKASCTAILWLLAEAVGLDPEQFTGSGGREVTRELTIHDLHGWPRELRLGRRDPETLDHVLAGEGWLRFTVVRHPFRRLWSAWQSKLLLREPQFSEKFSSREWFPQSIDSAQDVAAGFRRFVDALIAEPELLRADVHWAPQVDLTGHPNVAYTHLGKVEQLNHTIEVLRRHCHDVTGKELPQLGEANRTPLPYADDLFDDGAVEALSKLYAGDLEAFGYAPPTPGPAGQSTNEAWAQTVEPVLPALIELRARNVRVGDLQRHRQMAEEKLAAEHELLNTAREKQRTLRTRLRERNQVLRLLKADRQALRQLRSQDQTKIKRLQRDLRAARREVTSMRNSTSWRITEPLRRAGRLVKRS